MARNTCPSCGKPYNGRRCKHCLYEHYSEEIPHGLHTHAGEPLVIRGSVRKSIPTHDAFGCEKQTKKRTARLIPLILFVAVLSILGPVAAGITEFSSRAIRTISEPREPEVSWDAYPTTLCHDDGILIATDWVDGQEYTDGFSIAFRNDTGKNLTLSASEVIVNGYLLEQYFFFCEAPKGCAGQSVFRLDPEELAYSGITQVQTLTVTLTAYDSDSYDTVMEIGPLFFHAKNIPDFTQPNADQGDVLYEDACLRVIYRGYLPNSYTPGDASRGKMLFYLENATDQALNISLQDAVVNGKDTSIGLWCQLPPQTRTVFRMHLFALEDNALTRIEEVTSLSLQLKADNPEAAYESVADVPLNIPLGRLAAEIS